MKLKTVLLSLCLGFGSSVYAADKVHVHPKANETSPAVERQAAPQMSYPGFCQIEIINETYSDLRVYGIFDDNSPLSFYIYRYDPPHYVDLYYYNYCHNGMYINIQNPYYTVFSGWVNVNSTLRVIPFYKNQAKVELTAK